MSLIKHRPNHTKANHPFPYSAYVIKSFSIESSKHGPLPTSTQQQVSKHQGHFEQYLSVLEANKKQIIRQQPRDGTVPAKQMQKLLLEGKDQFRRTESILKKLGNQNYHNASDLSAVAIKIPSGLLKGEATYAVSTTKADTISKGEINRTRQKTDGKGKLKIVKTLSPAKKAKITDNQKIVASLRYQIVTVYSLLGRRQDFMNTLKGKKYIMGLPLKQAELEQRLMKYEEGRGKDKGRVKFNHITNEQLRSLKYKAKPVVLNYKKEKAEKVQYDEESDIEEEEEEEREEAIDFQTWKRRNGIGSNQKVFIIKGGYAELRRALTERGWHQNQDVWSPYFDFKWTTRICDINFTTIKHSQGVNHFNNNHHLTSKYGLTRRLRILYLTHGIDADKFYPRCFDLGDQCDFQNFVENFKFTFAESVMRRFLIDKERYKKLEAKIRIAYDVLKRRTVSFNSLTQAINKANFPTITAEEWSIITETHQFDQELMKEKLNILRKSDSSDDDWTSEDSQTRFYEKLDPKVNKILEDLKKTDPQFQINGMRNVWIAKPNFMSRGRGIRCFNNVYDIADYCLGQNCQFVVQKYIEHPLLIEGKKFDIRQWVLIQDFCPPKIWFYQECYIRFCSDEYSLDNIYNRFMHLTNNSVQKYSKKHVAEKSMWTMGEFKEFVGEEKWTQIQQKMKNIVVWSIKACEGSVTAKKGSAELVGYDFMIDSQLNPWLIEINMSPAMDYSTPITKKLVKLVLNDTAKLISFGSSKKSRTCGLYTCIYRGEEDLSKFNLYNIER